MSKVAQSLRFLLAQPQCKHTHESCPSASSLKAISTRLIALSDAEEASPESDDTPAERFFHEGLCSDGARETAVEACVKKLHSLAWGHEVEVTALDLSVADDAGEAARNALSPIDRRMLAEVKALALPPPNLHNALAACGILLDNWGGILQWRDCQRLLVDPMQFVARLRALTPRQVTAEAKQLVQVLMADPQFTVASMLRCSIAAAYVVEFVLLFMSWCTLEETDVMQRFRMAESQVLFAEEEANRADRGLVVDDKEGHEKILEKAVKQIPSCLDKLRSREKQALVALLPPIVEVQVSTASGAEFVLEREPAEEIWLAKEELEKMSGIPVLVQKWCCGDIVLPDNGCIAEFFRHAENKLAPVCINVVISMLPVWPCFNGFRASNRFNKREWRAACDALLWSATDDFGRAVAGYLKIAAEVLLDGAPHRPWIRSLVEALRTNNPIHDEKSKFLQSLESCGTISCIVDDLYNVILESYRRGSEESLPAIVASACSQTLPVTRLAMETLSKIGAGTVIPYLVSCLENARGLATRGIVDCLIFLLSAQPSNDASELSLHFEQRVTQDHVATVLRFFRSRECCSAASLWKATLKALLLLGAKDDERLHAAVLKRVKTGSSEAVEVVRDVFPRGHKLAADALVALLADGNREPDAFMKALREVAPADECESLQLRVLPGWLESRDLNIRRAALEAIEGLPVSTLSTSEELARTLQMVAEGDYPQLRERAQGILAQLANNAAAN